MKFLVKKNVDIVGNVSKQFSPSVYQPVQHLGRLLDQVGLVGVILELVVRLQVEDHVQRLPVVRHLLVQPSQVKLVLQQVRFRQDSENKYYLKF